MSHKKKFHPDLTEYKIDLLAWLNKRSQNRLFIMPVGTTCPKKRTIKHAFKSILPNIEIRPKCKPMLD